MAGVRKEYAEIKPITHVMRVLDEALDFFSCCVLVQEGDELATIITSRHAGIAEPQEHRFGIR